MRICCGVQRFAVINSQSPEIAHSGHAVTIFCQCIDDTFKHHPLKLQLCCNVNKHFMLNKKNFLYRVIAPFQQNECIHGMEFVDMRY